MLSPVWDVEVEVDDDLSVTLQGVVYHYYRTAHDMDDENAEVAMTAHAAVTDRRYQDGWSEYIEWASDHIKSQQEALEHAEQKAHDMRVLGYAQGMAMSRYGKPWRYIHPTLREYALAEAEAVLLIQDNL